MTEEGLERGNAIYGEIKRFEQLLEDISSGARMQRVYLPAEMVEKHNAEATEFITGKIMELRSEFASL